MRELEWWGVRVVPAVFLLISIGPSAQGDLIVNGSFESPSQATFTQVGPADGNASYITGWTVTDGTVDISNAANNGYVQGAAYDGAQYIDTDGNNAGTIAQSFAVVANTTYTVSFAYANNYVNVSSASATVSIFDGSTDFLGPTIFSHGGSAANDLGWAVFSAQFTATTSHATIQFVSDTPGQGGILLDAVSVSVTGTVPEPSSLALCGIAGLTGIGMAWKRRKRLRECVDGLVGSSNVRPG